jgi:hypothetical protein
VRSFSLEIAIPAHVFRSLELGFPEEAWEWDHRGANTEIDVARRQRRGERNGLPHSPHSVSSINEESLEKMGEFQVLAKKWKSQSGRQ